MVEAADKLGHAEGDGESIAHGSIIDSTELAPHTPCCKEISAVVTSPIPSLQLVVLPIDSGQNLESMQIPPFAVLFESHSLVILPPCSIFTCITYSFTTVRNAKHATTFRLIKPLPPQMVQSPWRERLRR